MEKQTTEGTQKYWLSLEQWRDDPEFKKLAEKEFMSSPLADETGGDNASRRTFLKLMGASLAMTSFGCVRRTTQKIVPYVNRPHEITPGINNYYASSLVSGTEGFGLVVTTREGRPIKLEGNPDHPSNRGALSARGHAHILSLYDPDRINGPKKNLLNQKKSNRDTVGVTWKKADKEIIEQLKTGKVALLTGSVSSPSTSRLINSFVDAFGAKHYQWDGIDFSAIREGQKVSYGSDVIPRYRVDRAKYVLSVGGDFLGTMLAPTEHTKDFSQMRRDPAEMNRLVVFEGLLSLTGTNADERYRVKPSQFTDLVMCIAHEMIVGQGHSNFGASAGILNELSRFKGVKSRLGLPNGVIEKVAKELWENRGQSVVIAGGMHGDSDRAIDLQIAVNFLNYALGNDGVTVDYEKTPYSHVVGRISDVNDLVAGLETGDIDTVIIHGTNPIYTLPSVAGFSAAIRKAKMVIYTGDRIDETGEVANFVLPDHHPLENWGDSEIQKGVFSIQQPTIRPLYDTRSFQDSLISWLKGAEKASDVTNVDTWYDYLKNNWRDNIHSNHRSGEMGGKNFGGFWIDLLQKGVFDTSAKARGEKSSSRRFDLGALKKVRARKSAQGLELSIYPTVGLGDGQLANVAWLQEFPDPVSKICWENYFSVSVKTAQEMGLKQGQMIELRVGNLVTTAPIHIQPGQHDGVIGMAVGYGRWAAGKVADGLGDNAYALAGFKNGRVQYCGLVAEMKKTKHYRELANPQGHHSMEGRQIVVEATMDEYKKNPGANIHRHKIFSLWDKHEYKGYKWGMSIDLNSCTGCGSCVIACQAENNVPTVGKKNVINGREMHWIRIDRYYVGEAADPAVVHMPVTCQHCDNAPCETVCPVAATTHSEEGTNDMIYNRCVGTRYCANNCPYKVRRFNWFDYTEVKSPLNMQMNPEVTVRSRGVMEKCTFCIHRIKQMKHNNLVEIKTYKDGDLKVACEQSCPADAIIFGDMNNPESRVSKKFAEERTYSLLEELNNVPSVRYQSKIRNVAQLKKDKGHGGGHH